MITNEIYFNKRGNTIVGDYSAYTPVIKAIEKKTFILFPHGLKISGNQSQLKRLADYILTFGNAMQTKAAWEHCLELSDITFLGWE